MLNLFGPIAANMDCPEEKMALITSDPWLQTQVLNLFGQHLRAAELTLIGAVIGSNQAVKKILVSAPQSMWQMWTVLKHAGPKHLGFMFLKSGLQHVRPRTLRSMQANPEPYAHIPPQDKQTLNPNPKTLALHATQMALITSGCVPSMRANVECPPTFLARITSDLCSNVDCPPTCLALITSDFALYASKCEPSSNMFGPNHLGLSSLHASKCGLSSSILALMTSDLCF